MLYHLHELNQNAMLPMRWMAQAVNMMATHPMMPASHTGLGRTVAAGTDVFERMTRRYPKPAFGLDETVVDGRLVPVVERELVSRPFGSLIHFERQLHEPRNDPKILVVAALSGHYATLMRGTVQALLPEHDVYITDWHNARDIPLWVGDFTMTDYVDHVTEYLRLLGPDCAVLAVCQPGVPVLAAASLMAEDDDPARPHSMILMGSPIDTRVSPTAVNQYAESKDMDWFRKKVIQTVPAPYMGMGRQVYPGFLQLSGFMAMNMDRHMDAYKEYFNHLVEGDGDSAASHRAFYDEYLAVLDLTASFYLETLEVVFKEHHLPEGRMMIGDRLVKPSAITDIALFTVEGEKDDITGLGQTEASHDLVSSLPAELQGHMVCPGVGHYGIFNGRRWREMILPRVSAFIHEQRVRKGFAGPMETCNLDATLAVDDRIIRTGSEEEERVDEPRPGAARPRTRAAKPATPRRPVPVAEPATRETKKEVEPAVRVAAGAAGDAVAAPTALPGRSTPRRQSGARAVRRPSSVDPSSA
ncbi:polyhydroxyalkanoate depolymerase [Roseospira visakhapatnamensis]|uniref:Poly(3-hydroxybutyrate) depolymerase n=1 Tax=Roseospira visakhapatnamensis TaxID=390880 RepID=A0A7W6W9E9_9PROT|nr:poly(3-hydroxybutyrate) depolymerase [Roseospira visakhapatnamensis]